MRCPLSTNHVWNYKETKRVRKSIQNKRGFPGGDIYANGLLLHDRTSIVANLLKLGSRTLLPRVGVAHGVRPWVNFVQRFPGHGVFLGTVLECSTTHMKVQKVLGRRLTWQTRKSKLTMDRWYPVDSLIISRPDNHRSNKPKCQTEREWSSFPCIHKQKVVWNTSIILHIKVHKVPSKLPAARPVWR